MESKPLELGLLRSFSPLDGLKSENLHALARKTALRELTAGRLLFKEGDTDKRTYYLVSGVIELLHENRTVLVIRGGSPEARNPIAPSNPRRYSARVVSDRIELRLHRQRHARHDADLGPDRLLRSERAEGRRRRRRRPATTG